MSQPCRWVSRIARVAMAVGTVVLFGAGSLAAQGTTGKIEGTVRDQAGAPVAGAQVLVVGTSYAGVTNEQGYYFINNVPAGVVTLRAQYIGYAPAEARNLRVLAGQTMTQPLTLSQQAVTVEGITVEASVNPLVPRDQVATKAIVQGDLISSLPADNVSQIARLQPGVVESARGLVIRGGRPGETATYIDGVLVRSMNAAFMGTGSTPEVEIGTNAVEEASVTTGAVGAEFGDAQAGVISLVTRAGGPSFSGSLSYATDELSGETYGRGLNRVEASVGGPLARNLTFFLATTLQGSQNAARGIGAEDAPVYVMSGLDRSNPEAPNGWVNVPNDPGDPLSDSTRVDIPLFERYSTGTRRPDDASDALTFSSKLRYSYGAGSSLALTYHRSRGQDWFFRGGNLYNPMSQRGSRQTGNAFVVNWFQNLSRSSERALTLEANLSWQRDEFVSGILDPTWVADNRDPFANFTMSNFKFITDFDNFPVDDQLVRNVRVQNCEPETGGRCIPFLGRTGDFASVGAYRTNPYGVTAGSSYFPSANYGTGGPTMSRETRLTGRAVLDWQANRYNRLKVGGDITRADMLAFASNLTNQIFMDAYHETPVRVGMFLSDRIDLGDLVIDLGLRYDRLNSGVMYPRTPSRVYSDPLRDGDLASALTAADTAVANSCAAFKAAADTVGWSTCNFVEAPSHSALAPSVRVSFPVTDRTGFRLSYAHQTQAPDFSLLVGGVNADINSTNTNDTFGRDLDFGRSIMFEFGVRHAFNDDMVLDISAYNKDKVADPTVRVLPIYDPTQRAIANINMVLNADFGNARGVELQLDRRIGQLFQARVGYTFQSARSTGSDPFEYLNTLARQTSSLTGDRTPPPQSLLTTRDNRTHTLAGTASFNFPRDWHDGTAAGAILENTGLFATFRFASGLAYTQCENTGVGVQGPGNGLNGCPPTEPLNASTMPWIKNVDLRVTRGLRLGGTDMTVFADFRNLFNWTNLVAIFAETGDIRNQSHRTGATEPVRVGLQSEASNLIETRSVTRGGVTQSLEGVDLSDCSAYIYGSGGSAGLPNCLLLRGAERRFGDGDSFFDSEEQATAFNSWYDFFNGPHTLRGSGFNLRLGFELNF